MKLSQVALALFAFAYMPSAFAGILTVEDSGRQVGGLNVSKGGTLAVDRRSAKLVTVGAGLRKKFGLLSIYVGELLVNDDKKYVCQADKAYDSLKSLNAVVVRLRFVYSVPVADLLKAFRDGFDANDINFTKGSVKQFLDVVAANGGTESGKDAVVSGEKLADGTEVVTYEGTNGKAVSIPGPAGFVYQVFALWLGKTVDSGAEAVKQNFVTCKVE